MENKLKSVDIKVFDPKNISFSFCNDYGKEMITLNKDIINRILKNVTKENSNILDSHVKLYNIFEEVLLVSL